MLAATPPAPAETEKTLPPVTSRFASETDEIPDFQRHVGPLLGRLGCNGRACHGSFQGQGGFQLTLFGYDFDADHKALTEDGSWRIDLKDPEESLILTKPTDADDHGGGIRFGATSWQYRLIRKWVEGGAKNFDEDQKLVSLQVTPTEIFTSENQVDQLRVVANWSNGIKEDVTPLVRFQSNDPQIAAVDENGAVTGGATGDTHLIVFYDNEVVNVPVISPVGKPTNQGVPFHNPTRIDELVLDKLNKLGMRPSELTDDAAFLRRVSLDITGTLPSPDEIRSFLADENPNKRSEKIEQLLDSPAYAAWWTTFLCDLTGNNSQQLRNIDYRDLAPKGWYEWIYKRVAENTPYDEIVEGIVLSSSRLQGESLTAFSERMSADFKDGKATRFAEAPTMPYYWMRQGFRTGDTLAISFAHSFLGVRLQCAQCHKHPFDQWTKQDFTQFSRFFSGVSFSPPQRTVPAEREELKAILAKLELDPELRGGQFRRKLSQAAARGKTVPFAELVVGPPRKSREELQAEQQAMKEKNQAMMEAMQSEMMQTEMNDEMSGEMQAGGDASTSKPAKPLTKQQRRKLQRQQREARQRAQRQRNRNRFYTDAILLGSDAVELKDFKDARLPAMNWLKHEDNPYFAKAIVNRIWAKYFGIGIVEPADDMNLANPPSNGPLLEYLADGFVENGYDLKWLHRQIANSHIYQLSWKPNETNQKDRRNFSRALPRRLPAEVIYDALDQATARTGVNEEFRNRLASRAIAIPGTVGGRGRGQRGDINFAMQIFGRSSRNNSCDCDRSAETSLTQTAFMLNDRHVHDRLAHKNSWIGGMRGQADRQTLNAEQRRKLGREEGRLAKLQDELRKAKDQKNQRRIRKLQQQVQKLDKRLEPLREQRKLQASQQQQPFDVEQLVVEAWLRTVSRFPTEAELRRCVEYIESDENVLDGLTGVMWTLVNTKEFIVNH